MTTTLTIQELREAVEAASAPPKVPNREGISAGDRYHIRVKASGEMQYEPVLVVRAPYLAPFGQGRQAWYVDVSGWNYRGPVLVTKLVVL
jgi:hypothetical protein